MQTIHSSATPKTNIFTASLAFFMLISTFVSAEANGPVRPDLSIISVTNFKILDQKIYFDLTVKNEGSLDAIFNGNFPLTVSLSNDLTIGNDTPIECKSPIADDLKIGVTKTYNCYIPYVTFTIQDYPYIVLNVNPTKAILEHFYTNNIGIYKVNISSQVVTTPPPPAFVKIVKATNFHKVPNTNRYEFDLEIINEGPGEASLQDLDINAENFNFVGGFYKVGPKQKCLKPYPFQNSINEGQTYLLKAQFIVDVYWHLGGVQISLSSTSVKVETYGIPGINMYRY
jgi:hypothetical protein